MKEQDADEFYYDRQIFKFFSKWNDLAAKRIKDRETIFLVQVRLRRSIITHYFQKWRALFRRNMTIVYGFARLEDARDRLLLKTILRKWKEWSSHHRAQREYQESCLEHVYQAKLVSVFRKWKTRYLEVNKLNYLLFKKEMNKKARMFDEWRIQTKLEQKRKYNELCELGRTALRAWYDYVHGKKQIEEKVKQVIRVAPVVTRAHIPVAPPLPPVRYGVDQPKSERLTMHHEPAPEVQEREEQVQEKKQKVEFSPYIETIISTREEEPLDFDSDLYIDELMRKIEIENKRGKEVLKHAMYSPVIDESFSFSKVMEQFEPIRYHLSKSIDRFMVPFTNELIVSEEMKKLGADTVDNWSRNMS